MSAGAPQASRSLLDAMHERIADWVQQPEQLLELLMPLSLRVAAAIAIFYVGKWAVKGLLMMLRRVMRRARVDDTLADFLSNVLYGLAIAVVVISALHQLGFETTGLAAMLVGAALAIGLALQQQLSSLAAGVIIIIFRPFKKGDFVEIGSGIKGHVEEIKIVHTRLRTLDNREVMVPNASITTNVITNFTARGTRRIELVVSASYESDLPKTKQLLHDIIVNDKRVLNEPAPLVEVKDLTQIAVEFNVYAWAKIGDFSNLRAALLEQIKLRFEREGIVIPYLPLDADARQPRKNS